MEATYVKSGYTLKKLKESVYKALDEYSENGEETDVSLYCKSDIEQRMLYAINSAVSRAELSMPAFIKEYTPRFFSPKPLFHRENTVLTSQSGAIAQNVSCSDRGLAFTLLAAGEGLVCIRAQSGEIEYIKEISSASSDAFDRIRFFTGALTAGEKQISVSAKEGSSLALYEITAYPSDGLSDSEERIPPYGSSCAALPEDFGRIEQIENNNGRCGLSDFPISGGIMLSMIEDTSSVKVFYTPKTQFFDEGTPEDEEITLPDITCLAVVFLAAAELCGVGNGELYSRLMYKYRDIALNCYDRKFTSRIVNSFFAVGSGKLKR